MDHKTVIFWSKLLNAFNLIGLTFILCLAFAMQFTLNELPCSLCLMQRIGIVAIGFGFLLNVRYHIRPSHYTLSILAAVFTAAVALRQISLHVVPGTGSYASPIFGLHLYTWVFIISILSIIYTAIIMSWPGQYVLHKALSENRDEVETNWGRKFTHFAFAFFFFIIISNVVLIFAQCGLNECPEEPVSYLMLSK